MHIKPKFLSQLIIGGKYLIDFNLDTKSVEGRIYTFDGALYPYIFIADEPDSTGGNLHSAFTFCEKYKYQEHPELGMITADKFKYRCFYINKGLLVLLTYIPEVTDFDGDDDDCI